MWLTIHTITTYEIGYQADCLEQEAIKIRGSLSGTLYYLSSDISTIEIEIPDFEILLLM